jgi:hypothetical protein
MAGARRVRQRSGRHVRRRRQGPPLLRGNDLGVEPGHHVGRLAAAPGTFDLGGAFGLGGSPTALEPGVFRHDPSFRIDRLRPIQDATLAPVVPAAADLR